MADRSRRWLTAVIILLLMAGSGYAGWRWGDSVFPRIESWLGVGAQTATEVAATPELAQRTVDRVENFRHDGEAPEMALGQAEVASVLRYAAPGVLPEGVTPPDVELRDGRVHLSTRVGLSAVPRVPELEHVLGILPDTVPVEIDGSLMPFGDDDAALVVHRIQASGIPLPRRLIPRLLEAFGRRDRTGLPPDAMILPLPGGLRSAYIHSDSLILVAAR